ncbi:MAG: hypothetical protein ABS916_09895 [Carnobacterium sp.]|uniref:hypothetical protein n=1 Tax=Carnobacterium sp. TaxID=48221 RepID=UPI0033153919
MTKQNKAEMFREAAAMLTEAPRYQELLLAEAERVDKMNEKRRQSETKTQKENRVVAAQVTEWFANQADPEVAYDGGEVQAAVGLELSPQKFAAIMRLVENAVKTDKADSNKDHVGYQKA